MCSPPRLSSLVSSSMNKHSLATWASPRQLNSLPPFTVLPLHSTFTHYVEESPVPLCLLVWKSESKNGSLRPCRDPALHYFVKSKGFHWYVDSDQISDPDDVVTTLLADSTLGVIKHEIILTDGLGQNYLTQAESFSNSYTVFTLISQPTRKSIQVVMSSDVY